MTRSVIRAAALMATVGVTAVMLLALLGVCAAAESITTYAIWAVAAITVAAIGVAQAYARRGR